MSSFSGDTSTVDSNANTTTNESSSFNYVPMIIGGLLALTLLSYWVYTRKIRTRRKRYQLNRQRMMANLDPEANLHKPKLGYVRGSLDYAIPTRGLNSSPPPTSLRSNQPFKPVPKPQTQKSVPASFIAGVPTVIMSKKSPSASTEEMFEKTLIASFNKISSRIKDLAVWFIEAEYMLMKQQSALPVPGNIFSRLFPTSGLKNFSSSDVAKQFDVYAVTHVISEAISENIYTLADGQTECQALAAYLKSKKVLSVPRSTISLLDWEVFTYVKEHLLAQSNTTIIDDETSTLLGESLKKSQGQVYEKLKVALPLLMMTQQQEEKQDPSDNRLLLVLFESMVNFFIVKSYDPMYLFTFIKRGSKFKSETMEFVVGSEEVTSDEVEATVIGGLKNHTSGVQVKATVF